MNKENHSPSSIPTFGELLRISEVRTPEPLVSNTLLVRDNFTLFGGPEDSFKSYLMCQLAVCLSGGCPWLGLSCVQCGTVVYVVMEGNVDYVMERIGNIAAALEVPTGEINERIRIIEHLYVSLDEEGSSGELYEKLREVNPDVVIFDPITYQVSQDVRYSPTMKNLGDNLLRIARDSHAACVGVIHTRKETKNNDNMDDLMGSSVLKAMAASRIKVVRPDENLVHLYAKTRYAERLSPLRLVFNDPILTLVEEIARPRKKAKNGVLSNLEGQSPNELGVVVEAVARTEGVNPKTVRGAIKDLEVEQKVVVSKLLGTAKKEVRLT